jgi:hypothetical protein
VNLVNNYIRSVATRNNGFNSTAYEEENALHPLVPVGAVQSIMDDQHVIWPERTKYNSKYSDHHGKDPKHARKRVMIPLLGAEVCARFPPQLTCYSMRDFKQSVQVGRWKYGLKVVEDKRKTGATRASWFRIKAKHVPHYKEYLVMAGDRYHPDDFVYGRINRFVRLSVWAQVFELAEVLLFQCRSIEPITGYPVIDTKSSLHKVMPEIGRFDFAYVQAKHLHSIVAVAPIHNFKEIRDDRGALVTAGVSSVLSLEVRARVQSPYFVLSLEV